MRGCEMSEQDILDDADDWLSERALLSLVFTVAVVAAGAFEWAFVIDKHWGWFIGPITGVDSVGFSGWLRLYVGAAPFLVLCKYYNINSKTHLVKSAIYTVLVPALTLLNGFIWHLFI